MATKKPTSAASARVPDLAPPPPPRALDSIDLESMKDQILAVRVLDRVREKETKFGKRDMTTMEVVAADSPEPIIGITFSSYFKDLPPFQWFVGKIVSVRRGSMNAWQLDPVSDKKAVAALQSIIATLPEIADASDGL